LSVWAVAFGTMTQTDFLSLLPERPYCTDNPKFGIRIRPRKSAVGSLLIQPNHPHVRRWLVFDLDHDDSYFAPEERSCPEPNFISVNGQNGHAHVGYLLSDPVTLFEKSRQEPIELYRAVERGLGKRLGADQNYRGLLCKNPTHPHWATDWQAVRGYDLQRLNDCLDDRDRKTTSGVMIGFGRNVSVFERLRKLAYMEAIRFKREGRTLCQFRSQMQLDALGMNSRLAVPMYRQEVVGIAKSVSKWVWRRFDPETFSKIQTCRIKRRWKGLLTATESQPWTKEGVSRATWYRRRALNTSEAIIS
jgi:hypothetical protein